MSLSKSTSVTEITRSECDQLLERAGYKKATLVAWEVRSFERHVGFMGEHCILYVKILIRDDKGKNKEHIKTFFVKHVPRTERHSNYVIGAGLFAKELEMYKTIFPLMCEHLKLLRLPVPDCYFVSSNRFIVLEDLAALGFRLHDKMAPLDLAQCELVMPLLAKFHAGSIAIEHNTGERMTSIAKHHQEVLLVGKNQTLAGIWHSATLNTVFGALKKLHRYQMRLKVHSWDLVHERLTYAWDKCSRMASSVSKTHRNVLCHGDLWNNNVLFKKDPSSGHVCEAFLVDFQIFRYCPAVLDLAMFLHLTTTRHFRERHLERLLLLYHQALRESLISAGIPDPESIQGCSLGELLDGYHEYRFFGVSVAVRYLPTCLKRSGQLLADMKRRQAEEALQITEASIASSSASQSSSQHQMNLPQEFTNDSSALLARAIEQSQPVRARIYEAIDELLDWLQL